MGILTYVTMLQKYKKILECTQLSKISTKFLLGQCMNNLKYTRICHTSKPLF